MLLARPIIYKLCIQDFHTRFGCWWYSGNGAWKDELQHKHRARWRGRQPALQGQTSTWLRGLPVYRVGKECAGLWSGKSGVLWHNTCVITTAYDISLLIEHALILIMNVSLTLKTWTTFLLFVSIMATRSALNGCMSYMREEQHVWKVP